MEFFSQLLLFHGRLDVWTTLLVLFGTWYWEVVQQTAVQLSPSLLKPLFDITPNTFHFFMEFLFLGCMVSVQHIFVQYLILWHAWGEEKCIREFGGETGSNATWFKSQASMR